MGGIITAEDEDADATVEVDKQNMLVKCVNCGSWVKEVCGDGYCRDCHKSCSWEDCITDTFQARTNYALALGAGLSKKEAKEFVKSIYPNAQYGEVG